MREVISIVEIAKRLGVGRETARRWAASKRIPAFRYDEGGHWRAYSDEIDAWIKSHQNTPQPGQGEGAGQ